MWRLFLREETYWLAATLLALDWVIRLALGARVIMRRAPVGYTLAWLALILWLPLPGALLYALLGDRRLGSRRARRMVELRKPYEQWLAGLAKDFPLRESSDHAANTLRRLARSNSGIPALPGNELELIDDPREFLPRLLADIEAAKSSVHLEFYIWQPGGRVKEIEEALLRAVSRGVTCRVLVDDAGSSDFIGGEGHSRLLQGGVKVVRMLEVGVLRALFERVDLRNHRKIAVIDGAIGYTGSQNLADPEVLRKTEDVGRWIDAMVRVTGPAVEALQVTLLSDWEFETYEGIENAADKFDIKRAGKTGNAVVQVVPSGPGLARSIQELVLTAVYAAETELILTTPYFVPDEAMRNALLSAAARGVNVTLVVPRRTDTRLVLLAGESYYEELLEGGVKIARFTKGVLHTKAITVDGEIAMFGSVNLDMRSFHLNFEISLLVYSAAFAKCVRDLQQHYIEGSTMLEPKMWRNRPMTLRFMQQCAQLLSPLL